MSEMAFEVTLHAPYAEALDRVIDALKVEGFGVLTRIDVHDTLKQKLDVDFREYAILGACNPPLAHKALSNRPDAGLMLPCNVIVEALEAGRWDDAERFLRAAIAERDVQHVVGTEVQSPRVVVELGLRDTQQDPAGGRVDNRFRIGGTGHLPLGNHALVVRLDSGRQREVRHPAARLGSISIKKTVLRVSRMERQSKQAAFVEGARANRAKRHQQSAHIGKNALLPRLEVNVPDKPRLVGHEQMSGSAGGGNTPVGRRQP